MSTSVSFNRILFLALGDILTFGLVTTIGFAEHRTLETAGARMLTTFLPLLTAWWLIGLNLGVYDQVKILQARELWRPFWTMVLAAPMAAWLRGLWLQSPIQPIFVIVIGGVSALAILAWRSLYLLVATRMRSSHG